MKSIFFALFINAATVCMAQNPDWQWARSNGGNNDNYNNGVGADAHGNSFITGQFRGPVATFGNITVTVNSYTDNLYIAKYDSTGNALWVVPSSSTSAGNSIAVDSTGNSYTIGCYFGGSLTMGGITITAPNDFAVFVSKLDPNGNVLWLKNVGYICWSSNLDVATDLSGNVYITGNRDTYEPYANIGQNDSLILTKLDTQGNVLWKRYATGNMWYKKTLSTNKQGDVFVGGQNVGVNNLDFHGAIITPTSGGQSGFVTKYDSSGTVQWAKQIGSGSYYFLNDICTDGNSNLGIAGYFIEPTCSIGGTTFTNHSPGFSTTSYTPDIMLVKLDQQGNILWAKQAGGVSSDFCRAIASDGSGNFFIAGDFYLTTEFDTTHFSSKGDFDLYAACYDASGNLIWVRQAGGTGLENGLGIASIKGRHVFVSGQYTSKPNVFGNESISAVGYLDVFIADINQYGSGIVTGISNAQVATSLFSFVPNPFSKETTITPKKAFRNASLILYNATGQEVKRESGIRGAEYKLPRAQLPVGIYFAAINEENELPAFSKIVISD